jgi:restriction endonuclease S subunit
VFSKKTKAEQEAELQKRFTEYLQAIEKDKLYFYVLASENKQKVLVVKCPSENKEQKQFLGYEWSNAKGNEGIKYFSQIAVSSDIEDAETKEMITKLKGLHNINTPLYNPNNRSDNTKVNQYIQQNFLGVELPIIENISQFIGYHNLVDMMEFNRITFNKQIRVTPKKTTAVTSKWDLIKLGEISIIEKGVYYSNADEVQNKTNNIVLTSDNITLSGKFKINKQIFINERIKFNDEKRLKKDDIFMCFASGSKTHLGKVAFISEDTNYYAGGFMGIIRTKDNKVLPKYLFEILNNEIFRQLIRNEASGSNINNLSSSISDVKIPFPPFEIQNKIIDECATIDNDVEVAIKEIEKLKKKMKISMQKSNEKQYDVKKLNNICSMQAGKFVKASEIKDKFENDLYPCYGGNGLRGYTKSFTHEGEFPLIGRQGALCGNLKIVNGKFHATEHAVVVTPNPDISTTWLFHQLEFLKLNQYATGAAQPGLSVQKILTVSTPVPPLNDQLKLVKEIEALEQVIKVEQTKIDTSADKIKAVMKKYL